MPPRKRQVTPARRETSLEALNNRMIAGWRGRVISMIDKRNTSQRRLSEQAGLGATSLNFTLKSGGSVQLDTVRRIANALDVSVAWLATGAHAVSESPNDDPVGTPIRLLQIYTTHDAEEAHPKEDSGTIAIAGGKHLTSARALVMTDSSMQAEGLNQPVPPQKVICPGDVVVWAHGARAEIGELVVARTSRGVVVRVLVQDDHGKLQIVANNVAFSRQKISENDVLGPVIAVQRVLRSR